MNEVLTFASREEFREWLSRNCLSEEGVWLLFGKVGGPKTIKAGEALRMDRRADEKHRREVLQKVFFPAQGEEQMVGEE